MLLISWVADRRPDNSSCRDFSHMNHILLMPPRSVRRFRVPDLALLGTHGSILQCQSLVVFWREAAGRHRGTGTSADSASSWTPLAGGRRPTRCGCICSSYYLQKMCISVYRFIAPMLNLLLSHICHFVFDPILSPLLFHGPPFAGLKF